MLALSRWWPTVDDLFPLINTLLLAGGDDLRRVRQAIVFLIALILSIAVHEFGHAIVADRLGDSTPRYQGRVTLNPIAHMDPIGTLIFPLAAFFFQTGILFGWGKPVQINPVAFTRKLRMKTSHLLVALAGPMMNIVLGVLVTIIYAVLMATNVLAPNSPLADGVVQVIYLNFILFFFNLVPCPPLDGGAVLAGLLPDRYESINEFLRQYGFIILLGLLLTGVIGIFIRPALWITSILVNGVHGLVG